MSGSAIGLDIVPVWKRFNDGLIKLVDYVPDDKINWSPREDLWNFRGILLHIAATRDSWLSGATKDEGPDGAHVWQTVRSKEQIKEAYARTWERVARFADGWRRLRPLIEFTNGHVAVQRQHMRAEGEINRHFELLATLIGTERGSVSRSCCATVRVAQLDAKLRCQWSAHRHMVEPA